MNIAIYGAGRTGEMVLNKINQFLGERNKLVYFVETKKTKEEHCGYIVRDLLEIKPNEFDVLIVAVPNLNELMNESLVIHPESEKIKKKVRFLSQIAMLFYDNQVDTMPYRSVQVRNNLKFITSSIDYTIGESMYMYDTCFAEHQINLFFELMRQYCKSDDMSNGTFLDIGANVGTTCIYAKKNMAPNLKYIGFEAGIDNYKMFKCNCIINEVEDITAEYMALGEKKCKGNYHYNQYNSGGSGVSFDDEEGSTINIQSLDEYIEQKGIKSENVTCIWLDTEGCEAEILLGAKELITSKKIPLMQEFNPLTYEKRGKDKEYYALMEQCYESFIDVCDVTKRYDISDLSEYKNILMSNGRDAADLFFY